MKYITIVKMGNDTFFYNFLCDHDRISNIFNNNCIITGNNTILDNEYKRLKKVYMYIHINY